MNNEPKPWEEVSREEAYKNFMKVDKVSYRLPDNKTAVYDIQIARPATAVVAITPDNEVILTKQFRPGPNEILLELPGGYINEGEEPTVAALRELKEETGYTGEIEYVTHCFDTAESSMNRACMVANNCHKVSEQSLDETEFIDVVLLPLDEFRTLLRSGKMTDVEVGYLGLDYLNKL